jgi:NAD(P)-dependent dehydrogenase (short-subunit alcohol dehydrogenase family)
MSEFDGKVALVTGASSGIGRSTAILYAKYGAHVVVSDVDAHGGEETVEMINQAEGKAIFVRTDVSKFDECQSLVQQTMDRFGRLDFACNNAGIGGESNPVAEMSEEAWNRVISINLSGVFYCMHHEIKAMLQNGGGSIVNMSSILGQVGFAGSSAYVSTKHGILGLTRTAALEYSKAGVRVNAVGPAFIVTPMIQGITADPNVEKMLVAAHPIGRLGQPEEVAELVIWLSSDKASFVSGGYYPVDGGYLAQ